MCIYEYATLLHIATVYYTGSNTVKQKIFVSNIFSPAYIATQSRNLKTQNLVTAKNDRKHFETRALVSSSQDSTQNHSIFHKAK